MAMSTARHLVVILVFFCTILTGNGQENTQPRVARSLEECYRNEYLLDRDNRLPMTIDTLIDLIKKAENASANSLDMRQMTISLLHRFRQDGIVKAEGVEGRILPYSPKGFQFPKHRILFSRLLPGDARNFPNDTLNIVERCTLHFMLSNSIDTRVRGDEAERCSQLSQYRAMRVPRDIKSGAGRSNFLGDVELLEEIQAKVKSKPSSKITTDEDEGVDDLDYEINRRFRPDDGYVEVASGSVSQCPVENGVVWTPWGAVSTGTLLAGIAAGLQPQSPQLQVLLQRASQRPGRTRNGQQEDFRVNNKWAATLAGDLAEVSLLQAPRVPENSDLTVGAAGAWNSTSLPHWYFLTQRENLQMTDAEIRAGLDGLIIATKIDEWKSKSPNMKLSQLLEMYYSQRGVLDSGIRACDRRKHFTTVAPVEEMKSQAQYFATLLDREMVLEVTLDYNDIKAFSYRAVDALNSYIPGSLNDLSCEATAPTPNDPTIWYTSTDLYVYVEAAWQFRDISPILGYLFRNINLGDPGSRLTLLNAADGNVIVNRTTSYSDIFAVWNASTHDKIPRGFNLPNILKGVHNLTAQLLNEEKRDSISGGRSLICLIVPNIAGVNDADANFADQRIQQLREQVPDLKILFAAGGAANRFARFVNDEKDYFSLRTGDNAVTQANPIIKRIREIPRRITNPRCGSNWWSGESGSSDLNQYVSPGSVNYYRLHPNYFFAEGGGRKIRVQGPGGAGLTVCSSRSVPLPRANGTQANDVNCQQLATNSVDFDLSNPCDGAGTINACSPFYLSIESKKVVSTQASCTDAECLFPDQIKVVIKSENLGCFSGVERILSNSAIVIGCLYLIFKMT